MRRATLMQMMERNVLVDTIDYGVIPGTEKKTLLQPGAQKLAATFGLEPDIECLTKIEDWTGADHGGEAFFYYEYKVTMRRDGKAIGVGIGSANSWDSKHRFRWVNETALPEGLDKSTLVRRGGRIKEALWKIEKAETSGKYGKPQAYWDAFQTAKAEGRVTILEEPKNERFARFKGEKETFWSIEGYEYRLPNDKIYDVVNTVNKMAAKRAFVAAVLMAVGGSEFFTQDVEDMEEFNPGGVVVAAKPAEAQSQRPVDDDVAQMPPPEEPAYVPPGDDIVDPPARTAPPAPKSEASAKKPLAKKPAPAKPAEPVQPKVEKPAPAAAADEGLTWGDLKNTVVAAKLPPATSKSVMTWIDGEKAKGKTPTETVQPLAAKVEELKSMA